MPVVRFWLTHREELAALVAEHVLLVAVATMAAVAIGVPLGVFATRRPRLAAPLVGIANVVQTVPSLAMFGFLLPVPLIGGVGARAALVVLVLYALLPILRSTIVGITGIDRSVREAGLAMGMTERELLRQVELPLALPSIIAGVRVAAVVGVGSATIAAAIGAGGLGQYIYRGLSMVDSTVILAGAIPAAVLALAVDGALLWLERELSPRRRARPRRAALAVAGSLAAIALGGGALMAARASGVIVVGSKNFTEQLILGEIVAQTIEREAGLSVRRRLNLGGTLICDRALLAGDIDVYVEYTGTALTAIFQQPPSTPSAISMRAADARFSARSVTTTRSRFSCAARTPVNTACGRSTTWLEWRRGGGRPSDTNSSNGRTATPGWPGRTAWRSVARRR
jgi:osmoprotectant transport system permease protein